MNTDWLLVLLIVWIVVGIECCLATIVTEYYKNKHHMMYWTAKFKANNGLVSFKMWIAGIIFLGALWIVTLL